MRVRVRARRRRGEHLDAGQRAFGEGGSERRGAGIAHARVAQDEVGHRRKVACVT